MGRERKESTAVKADPNAWMATFSDLVTLLITFFVLLLSMSSLDSKPLKDTFGFFDDRIGVLHMSDSSPSSPVKSTPVSPPIYDSSPQVERDHGDKALDEISKGIPGEVFSTAKTKNKPSKSKASAQGVTEEDANMMQLAEQIEKDRGELEDLFENHMGKSNREKFEVALKLFKNPKYEALFKLLERDDNLTINFAGDLIFQQGRVLIRPESLVLLKEMGALLKQLDVKVRVVGIVPDASEPAPTRRDLYPDQWSLAVARSGNVIRYIISATGLEPSRISGSVRPSAEVDPEQKGVFFELRLPEL